MSSEFIIEIQEPVVHTIEIETSFLDTVTDNIEIERYDVFNVEITNSAVVLASDLPDNIPITKIVGNLSIQRIDFGDPYGIGSSGLSAFLNDYDYEFDCGTP
jgi:hypothetical protein